MIARINIFGITICLLLFSLSCTGCSGDFLKGDTDILSTTIPDGSEVKNLRTPEVTPSQNDELTIGDIEKTPEIITTTPASLPEGNYIMATLPGQSEDDLGNLDQPIDLESGLLLDTQLPFNISNIGDESQLCSPLKIEIQAIPSENVPLILALYGEDGRLIARRLFLLPESNSSQLIGIELQFEIASSSENGRLILISRDEFNRLKYVQSRDILLLGDGEEKIVEPQQPQVITITSPADSSTISGGALPVMGELCSPTLEPLRVSLVREDGSVVGQRLAGLKPAGQEACSSFATEIAYTVSEKTPVRLMVFQSGSPISEIKYLTSIPLFLTP